MAIKGEFWIADDVIAHVENGDVTISIQHPTRSHPKEKAEKVADPIWLEGQLRKLELARKQRETTDIPLTDRLKGSFLRLGGGFLIVQGKRIILIRRDKEAPRRKCQLCECGGIYEVVETDPYDSSNDLIASLLKECAEVALIRGDKVYIPEFVTISKTSLSFQPSGLRIKEYDEIVSKEFEQEIKSAKLPVINEQYNFYKFHASILNYENSVKLQFADSPAISVDFTAELETSSLEFVGVLSFPDDVDLSAIAYLDGKVSRSTKEDSMLEVLRNDLDNKKRHPLEYWDTECNKKNGTPLNREILLIDIKCGKTHVWKLTAESIEPDSLKRKRVGSESDLWKELSKTNLELSNGRYITEKAEKAIKMHCPMHFLQPLITL